MLISAYMDMKGGKSVAFPNSEPGAVFHALSDVTRLRLVQLLLLEELNVTELVDILGLPQSSVSRQLKVLRDVGLVQDRRVGATSLYSAVHRAMDVAPDGSLTPLLMNWLGQRPLPAAMGDRLQRVVNQRAGQSPGFFNRIGRRWDELRTEAFGTAFAMEAFIALLPREWTVADIGTGTGHLLPALSSHFAKVIAIEPAEVMLKCARQRATGEDLSNVELRNGDLTKLPADDECVDLAIAMLVLHHVANPNEALAEMARVVRSGGRVLIVEQESHENQSFYERMQDHWWGFDPRDLERRLVGTGFENVSSRRLLTAASDEGSPDSPSLFVLTGIRSG